MANLDQPQGARPYGKIKSIGVYEAGSACYPGDFVAMASDGQVDPVSAGDNPILGVALNYAGSAGDKLLVSDSLDQKYIVQADEADIDVQTDIGQTCDVLATAGNSTYKTSRHELDSSTIGTEQQLLLLGISREVGNALGSVVDVIVQVNRKQFNTADVASVQDGI